MSKYIPYAKATGANDAIISWLESTLENYLEKNTPEVSEVEHVIDYLVNNKVPKMHQMSYPQAVKKAERWTKELQKKADRIEEEESDTKAVLDFKDGFKVVQLIGQRAYKREGFLMRNCVASYYGKDTKIYSLRDRHNEPHCTMEWGQQIKGKGNGSIHPKYISYVVKFLEFTGMDVRDSEMKNLGYVNVEKYKGELSKENNLFKEKYWYTGETLLSKDGGEFASLDMLDDVPLIDSTTLKINFKLNTWLPIAIKFLFKKVKAVKEKVVASSGDYAQLASSGDFAKVDVKGKDSVAAAIGYQNMIKGVLGTWITLAEYDDKGIVRHVKTGRIDGKKLLPGVWYQLKNKRFVEVKN